MRCEAQLVRVRRQCAAVPAANTCDLHLFLPCLSFAATMQEYTGTRYTLIYFIQQSFRKLGRIKGRAKELREYHALGFKMPPVGLVKQLYETKEQRLLKGKASFRKWEECRRRGERYSWAGDEDIKTWQRDEDFVDPLLDDFEEEEKSWMMLLSTQSQTVREAVGQISARSLRRLARSGGVRESAHCLMSRYGACPKTDP
eukprot:SAG11_NODE_647_length_7957_cov_2.900903_2_plen_200_part_00